MSDAPKVIWAYAKSFKMWRDHKTDCPHEQVKYHHDDTVTDLQAKVARLEAENKSLREDRDFIDAISNEYWDVKCFDIPTGQGDADIGWVVISHHMAEPRERKEAEVWQDDLRAAVRQALKETTDD